mgnify:CR=1 FL=1
MWEFFVKNNRFSALLMVSLLGLGLFSVNAIPKENAPEVVVPVGVVTTILPGAPAADVESLITNEIERSLAGSLENVSNITSTSREGVSSIIVEFDASADLNQSIQDLKDEVDLVTSDLPDDANDPMVSEVSFVDQPILSFVVSGNLTDLELVDLGNEVENEIESIAGVSRVEKSGIPEREVTVVVDLALLERFELTVDDVRSAIATANTTFPIGQIESSDIIYNIAFEGDLADTAEITNVVVSTRDGTPIYIRDLAVVEDDVSDRSTLSRLSLEGAPSQQSVSFDVYKRTGGDITQIATLVNERLAQLQEQSNILSTVDVYLAFDLGDEIRTDLLNLTSSGLMTVVLVVFVLILAIGWREGLIAGTAIPLSFTIGFIGLYFSGNTINFVSLFALILGIGVLVDSGIVMVEGINKRMKDNPDIDKTQAALLAVREFSRPLTSGTLTTISMFVGLFIVSGVTGQFIASIPFTLVFVLLTSLLVALGFLPLIASIFLRRRSSTAFEQQQTAYAKKLEAWYRKKLSFIVGNKKREQRFIWGIIGLFILAIALIPAGFIRVVFFEDGSSSFITVEVELPEGTTLEKTDLAVRRVEDFLYTNDNIEAFITTVGSGSVFASGESGSKLGNIFVGLKDDSDIDSREVIEDLRTDFADIRDFKISVSQPEGGPPTGDPIGVKLKGDDLTELALFANKIAEIVKTIDNTTNVTTSNNSNATEYVLELDKQKAAALGLSPQLISYTLRTAVFGVEATTLTSLTDDIAVFVKLNLNDASTISSEAANVTSIDTIRNLRLRTQTGSTVLLGTVANIRVRESNALIRHEDQKRIVSVSAEITDAGNVLEINQEILNRIDNELEVPESIEISLGGENEESNQAFIEMGYALIVGIVLMIGVLVLQFNSYRHTFYVLSIIPFSLIGILAGLALVQQPLSFPSIMGFIALTGIVVNNSILLIDMMNHLRVKYPERPVREVVLDAAAARLRPILLTTLTTVIGMVPLLTTDPIWVPLAVAIMFGLSFSVVITLVLVPVIYNWKPGRVHQVD